MFLRRRLSTWRGRLFKHGKMRINDHSPFAWWNPYGKKVSDWKSGGRPDTNGEEMKSFWGYFPPNQAAEFGDTEFDLMTLGCSKQPVFENCNAVYDLESVKRELFQGGLHWIRICRYVVPRSVAVIGCLAWLPSSFTGELVSFNCLFSELIFVINSTNGRRKI